MKKLAKAEAARADTAESGGVKKRRQEVRREEKLNKWYMGMYGGEYGVISTYPLLQYYYLYVHLVTHC